MIGVNILNAFYNDCYFFNQKLAIMRKQHLSGSS